MLFKEVTVKLSKANEKLGIALEVAASIFSSAVTTADINEALTQLKDTIEAFITDELNEEEINNE